MRNCANRSAHIDFVFRDRHGIFRRRRAISRPTLRLGAGGKPVRDLQDALNPHLAASARLTVDGIHGVRTFRAVRGFQGVNWLSPDGIAGPRTREVPDDPGTRRTVLHGTAFHAQPDGTSCRAAATAPMPGLTVSGVRARTPPRMVSSRGGLLNASEFDDPITGRLPFARAFGLRILPPMSHAVGAPMEMLDRSPLMVEMVWNPKAYAQGQGSDGHRVRVPGGTARTGADAVLRVHDPGPAKRGTIRAEDHSKRVRAVPALTDAVHQRG